VIGHVGRRMIIVKRKKLIRFVVWKTKKEMAGVV
jgi:hypothetical protein